MDEENDSDSDVVLEDSPLYEYLKNVENQNLIPTSKHKIKDNSKESQQETSDAVPRERPTFTNLLNAFVHTDPSIDLSVIRKISDAVLKSKLLSETDYSLLEQFSNNYFANNSRNTTGRFGVLGLKWPVGLFLMLAFSINCFLLFADFICCWTVLITTFAVFFATLYWFQNVSKHQTQVEMLQILIEQFKLLCRLLKKGIRTIQEAELIARGFTLVSIRAPLKSLESSSTLPFRNPEKQCPELRQAVFKYSRELFLTYRSKTLLLLKDFPLHKDMDMASHYLACIDLQELGKLFTEEYNINNHTESYFLEITDDYSTSTLKALMEIMDLQQSELLRRIAFCFLAETSSEQLWAILQPCFEELLSLTKKCISVLEKIHLYYSCIGTLSNKDIIHTVEKEIDVIKPFRVAVRSLYLHLQASLVRIQSLEESIDFFKPEMDLFDFFKGTCKPFLAEVESELNASNLCFSESEDCLDRLINPKRIITKHSYNNPIATKSEEPNRKEPIHLFEIGDPIIVDEVFEGSAEKMEIQLNDEDDVSFYEVSRKKKEKPINLLKELKSVLVLKAEEHKIREAKALGVEPESSFNGLQIEENADAIEQNEGVDSYLKEKRKTSEKQDAINYEIRKNEFKLNMNELGTANFNSMNIAAQAALKSKMFALNCTSYENEEFIESNSDQSD